MRFEGYDNHDCCCLLASLCLVLDLQASYASYHLDQINDMLDDLESKGLIEKKLVCQADVAVAHTGPVFYRQLDIPSNLALHCTAL